MNGILGPLKNRALLRCCYSARLHRSGVATTRQKSNSSSIGSAALLTTAIRAGASVITAGPAALFARAATTDASSRKQGRTTTTATTPTTGGIRLSKLLSSPHFYCDDTDDGIGSSLPPMSRREAERLIRSGSITVDGRVAAAPHEIVRFDDGDDDPAAPSTRQQQQQQEEEEEEEHSTRHVSIKVKGGKAVVLRIRPEAASAAAGGGGGLPPSNDTSRTRVWIANKLPGEIVTDSDPHGRPSLMKRLARGGVGKRASGGGGGRHRRRGRAHLKAVGRLDVPSEGLVLVTDDGSYAREMELPSNCVHRTYRVRAHGHVSEGKLARIRHGMVIDGVRYAGMRARIDDGDIDRKQRQRRRTGSSSTNTWLEVTCTEGKNRQIRKVFGHLGLSVTRLIRVAYGDYSLQTIPPGMCIEVPAKPLERQRNRGPLFPSRKKKKLWTSNGGGSSLSSSTRRQRLCDGTGGHDDRHRQDKASPVQWVRYL